MYSCCPDQVPLTPKQATTTKGVQGTPKPESKVNRKCPLLEVIDKLVQVTTGSASISKTSNFKLGEEATSISDNDLKAPKKALINPLKGDKDILTGETSMLSQCFTQTLY